MRMIRFLWVAPAVLPFVFGLAAAAPRTGAGHGGAGQAAPAQTVTETEAVERMLAEVGERPPGSCPRFFFRRTSHRGRPVPECPAEQGLYLLPRTFPPGSVFVGYAQHDTHVAFLEKLLARARSFYPPIPVNILVPRNNVESAYYTLQHYLEEPYSDFVNVFLTPSDETLWTQDYFEAGLSMPAGRAVIIDLPYVDREGEQIPSGVALSCHMNMVPQGSYSESSEAPANGDYGGNVEAFPGNLVLTGDSMNSMTREILGSYLGNEMLTVQVSWLEIGHVDEILSVVPLKDTSGVCDFAVTYASPALGLAILSQNEFIPHKDALFPRGPRDVEADVTIEKTVFAQCFSEISRSRNPELSQRDAGICDGFVRANRIYERIIQDNLRKVALRMTQKLGCEQIHTIPLPQLFAPAGVRDEYGTPMDAALAVNPNAVNSISLEDILFLPVQPYRPFQDEIIRRLGPTELSLEFVDASYVHYLSGGIHCISNVVRTCMPGDPDKLRRAK